MLQSNQITQFNVSVVTYPWWWLVPADSSDWSAAPSGPPSLPPAGSHPDHRWQRRARKQPDTQKRVILPSDTKLLTNIGLSEDLFEVGHREQLLDPGQEVRYERLQGGVKALVENLLKQT